MKKKKGTLMIILLLVILASIVIYWGNNALQVSRYVIKSDKIPKEFNGFKILQISDLHSKSFGKNNEILIKKIQAENPDIIVMTGDMVDANKLNIDTFINLAKVLGKRPNVYYILGNHEGRMSAYNRNLIIKELKAANITVLNNEKVEIYRKGDYINLYGMWFDLKYYVNRITSNEKDITFKVENMQKLIGQCDTSKYNILLIHNPLYFNTYAQWGADLSFSGHIHGGMIRIPFVGGLFSPERTLFPKYDAGEFDIEGKKLMVNRGLGNGIIGFRVFDRPEISVITLGKN